MKKIITTIALVVICLSLISGGTLAYYTTTGTARNVITTGGVNIKVIEYQMGENGLVPYPKDEKIPVMPATEVSKIVTIKNVQADCYVRARIEMILKDANKNVIELPQETMNSMIRLQMSPLGWTELDGWWYYNDVLPSGSETPPLMNGVEFDGPNLSNEYQNCTLYVNVYAQAVQSANNETDVLTDRGWPA